MPLRHSSPLFQVLALSSALAACSSTPPAGDGGADARTDASSDTIAPDAPVADEGMTGDAPPVDGAADALADDAITDAGPTDATDVPAPDGGTCNALVREHPILPASHVPAGTNITWNSNPPSSGDHFGEWARWQAHTTVVPRGNYVHNLEHGGVVVLYRCSGDCSAVRTALESFVRSLEPEPMCAGSGVARRIMLTEDPLIDTPVAAAAWGWTYTASCVDAASLEAFVRRTTGLGPESVCFDGSYPPS